LFSGFNITDYLQRSLPTDMPALLCCLWSCYLAMVFVHNKNRSAQFGIVLGAVNAMPGLLRYMYVGIAPVVPLLLIWNGWYKKDKRLLRGGMYSLAVTIILLGAMLLFQHAYTGSSMYTRPAEQGFFVDNLQYTNPFVFSTIANLDFYNMQLSLHSGISYAGWTSIEISAGFFPLAVLLYVFVKYCITTKMVAETPIRLFFITGGMISFFVWLVLCYVSVRNSAHYMALPPFDWVYISEARYFAIVLIVLQVFFAWWLFLRVPVKFKRLLFLLRFIFLLCISIEVLHGAYYIIKCAMQRAPQVQLLTDDRTKSVINQVMAENKRKNVTPVFASNNALFCGEAFFAGANVLYTVAEVNNPVIKATRPTMLVLYIDMSDANYFHHFLNRKGVTKINQQGNNCFFTYYIEPGVN
jgi:hypothetical protein